MNNLLLSLAMAALGQFGGIGGGIGGAPGGAPGLGIGIGGGLRPGYPGAGMPGLIGPGGRITLMPASPYGRFGAGQPGGGYPGGGYPGGGYPGGFPGGYPGSGYPGLRIGGGMPGGDGRLYPEGYPGSGSVQPPQQGAPSIPSSEAEAFGLTPYR